MYNECTNIESKNKFKIDNPKVEKSQTDQEEPGEKY